MIYSRFMGRRKHINGDSRNAKARYESFAKQYVINHFNGTQAAIAAGYSPKTAGTKAEQLLNKVEIQGQISALIAAANKKLDFSVERTMQELARCAFIDPRLLFEKNGSLKKISEMDEDTARCIAGVETSGRGRKKIERIKLTDKLRALDIIARTHKLYVEDRNIQDTGVKVIVLDMPRPDRSAFKNASALPELPAPNGNGSGSDSSE